MHTDAADVVTASLQLAGVDAGPDLQVELRDRGIDRASARDGTGRAVERGEDPVTRRLHEAAAVRRDLFGGDGIVVVEHATPRLVADRHGLLGRSHDVGEEHRGQHPLGRRRS